VVSAPGAPIFAGWMALLCLAGVARAASTGHDDEALADRAHEACRSGRVDEGVRLLRDYLARTDDPNAVFNIARCYQQNGRREQAVAAFHEYLHRVPRLALAERAEVEGHLRALESTTPVPATAVVEGRADAGRPALRMTGLALGAAGVVALGSGTLFGLQVRSANHDLGTTHDGPTFLRRTGEGERAETRQWVFLSAGAAAVAAGGLCYFLGRPHHSATLAVVPWVAHGSPALALAGRY
jgi:hypothetical protein